MVTTTKVPRTPHPLVNAVTRGLLRTPGMRRLMGKTLAVMTVTGAVTGRRYSTPVQYYRFEGDYVVLSQPSRRWWRNIVKQPSVELLVEGEMIYGNAVVAERDPARVIFRACLEGSPRLAKYYGIESGRLADRAAVDNLADEAVVLVITPDR